ncbi:McrC family protein [Ectobacillus antri]|jgi:5-methylcytosine-specific restriction enzyme subunit McrC|uniref:McrC family protein n=1 Tax=Ectobacillus antri TaxID=2486280 RepID=UPI000F5AE431|nr:ATP-dependent helicase [Ectobacillus antri]
MSKVIVLREAYDWINEGDITSTQFEELLVYIKKHYNESIVELQHKRLRFINYIGVIQCTDIRYEIVPKITLSATDDRKALLSMLAVTNFLPISFQRHIQNGTEQADLLEAFLITFTNHLLHELQKGVYKTYERHEENLYTLKGKLQLQRHIQKNAFSKVKAYCEFDEHTMDNALNRLLKLALLIVKRTVKTSKCQHQIARCLGYLDDVTVISKMQPITFSRQNERFRNVASFAQMIIEKSAIYSNGTSTTSFSFLLPMNLLFEAYIEVALRTAFGTEKILSQHAEIKLLRNKKSGKGNILLKPDFVINETILLDTKWKAASYNGRNNYVQSDIYQMYAYVTAYKQATRCILLYPQQEHEGELPIWEVIDTEKTIEMHTIRLDCFENSVADLKKLLGK